MNIKHIWRFCFLMTIGALFLVLMPHWGMTFTNPDDPVIAQMGYSKGILQGSIENARVQGRFWLIPILSIAQLPHLLDSWIFVNSLKIIVNGLVFLSFILFCTKLTNKFTGILIGMIWLALIDINSSDFSPIHGYLLMFNLQFLILFLSFYLFLVKLENPSNSSQIVMPYLLFAFSLLAYEPMLFYSFVFPALYLYQRKKTDGSNYKPNLLIHTKKFLAQNLTLVAVVLLYIILYFSFRKLYATSTRGIDSFGNLYDVIRTIFNFSIHGLHVLAKPFSVYILNLNTPTNIFLAVTFAGLLLLGMALIIPRIENNLSPSYLYNKSSLLILGFFIFSPNILFGFVETYRRWASSDPHYVGNYFSSFPLAMAITLFVLYLVGGQKSKHEKALFFIILYVFFFSASDNYLRWSQLADTNREASILWNKAIISLKQHPFDPNKQSSICTNNAPKTHITGNDKYWSQYLSKELSRNIIYESNRTSNNSCDVTLEFNKI